MGWKTIRDHYDLRHTVTIEGITGRVVIGSAFSSRILVFERDGRLLIDEAMMHRALLDFKMRVLEDRATFTALLEADDVFEMNVPVYTWSGARIVEQHCETPGWPNVTHDGELMYENTHFVDRRDAVRRARKDADLGLDDAWRQLDGAIEELLSCRRNLAEAMATVRRLEIDEPNT